MTFDADGNLYLSTGDDTNPFASDNYTPIDERPTRNPAYDAQRSAANTGDLRGKVVRIHPEADGTYTIPAGNLFAPGTAGTRPEIYAMGFRNPFRISVDKPTGRLYLGDYGPDAQAADENRGPQGVVEFNQIAEAGNYGWPYCTGPNLAYRDYDFATGASGSVFDCAAPVNESPRNTGLRELPSAKPAWIHYDGGTVYYDGKATDEFGNGGEAPMGGPVYRYDPALQSDVKFPETYDGQLFVGDWSRGWIKTIEVGPDGEPAAIHPFFDTATIAAPMDMEFGPDGSLYVLDYGSGSYAGGAPDSALYKINHVSGSRAPVAASSATPDNGPAPLTVSFSSAGSRDPDGEPITYAWDFDGDGEADSAEPNPTHVYTETGSFTARLKVTDLSGKSATSAETITVGNTRPEVRLELPGTGRIFDHGDTVPYRVVVSDPDDGAIDCGKVVVQTSLGHNEHAHGDQSSTGCEGSFVIPPAWEPETQFIFYVVTATYTDGGAPALTGTDQALLQPRVRQAEHFTSESGVAVEEASDPAGGGGRAIGQLEHGDYVSYAPIDLAGVDRLDLRLAAGPLGGTIRARIDAPDGPQVGSLSVPGAGAAGPPGAGAAGPPGTGAAATWTTLSMPVTDPGGAHELYLVFENVLVPQNPVLPGSMLRLNFVAFAGSG
jgi:PKD repeat protein